MNGYARINQFDYEAFNESDFLKEQVGAFKELFGCYPELVQTDDIYRILISKNGASGTHRTPTWAKAEKQSAEPYFQCNRYWVDRSFDDAKNELRLSGYQVRKWIAWQHHQS